MYRNTRHASGNPEKNHSFAAMKEITIRQAVKEDCPRMMELIHELAEYEKAPNEVTVSPEHFTESGFGRNPVWWAWVAEVHEDGKAPFVIGFALWYIRYSTWKGQRLYLEDIIITEAWRGKGVGKMLFDKLIGICQEKQFSGMAWQVLDWNEPAIHFYKKYLDVKFEAGWLNGSLPVSR